MFLIGDSYVEYRKHKILPKIISWSAYKTICKDLFGEKWEKYISEEIGMSIHEIYNFKTKGVTEQAMIPIIYEMRKRRYKRRKTDK